MATLLGWERKVKKRQQWGEKVNLPNRKKNKQQNIHETLNKLFFHISIAKIIEKHINGRKLLGKVMSLCYGLVNSQHRLFISFTL